MNKSVSIIIPFYKKMNEFRIIYPHNYESITNLIIDGIDIEVIISMDHNCDELDIINFLEPYSSINYSIVVNDKEHQWRNPAKAINVGIVASNHHNCLVLSPESLMDNRLIQSMLEVKNESNFVIGRLKNGFIIDGKMDFDNLKKFDGHYGSIMFSKQQAELIRGYNECFDKWGCDDDDFRKRLILNGDKRVCIDHGVTHFKFKDVNDGVKRLGFNRRRLKENQKIIVNGEWGQDFSRKIIMPKK